MKSFEELAKIVLPDARAVTDSVLCAAQAMNMPVLAKTNMAKTGSANARCVECHMQIATASRL